MKLILIALLLLFSSTALADDKIPALNDIPTILADADKMRFRLEKQALEGQLSSFQAAGDAFNAKAAEDQSDEEFGALETQQTNYVAGAKDFNRRLEAAWSDRVLDRMIFAVHATDWTDKEKERAENALRTFDEDGLATTSADVRRIWQDIQARRGDEVWALKAAQGTGPGMPGAGNQTVHEDCAIFALANAAGVPYGAAAARATQFIEDGEWRPAEERTHPQAAIEKRGLMGGEVILVAEAFGQAVIVPSDEFVGTLEAGRPVMVGLFPYNGSFKAGHEVVLTKTFPHEGAHWFELIDSNEKGSQQRLYLSETELGMLLQETGVTILPDDKSVVKPLREGAE